MYVDTMIYLLLYFFLSLVVHPPRCIENLDHHRQAYDSEVLNLEEHFTEAMIVPLV